MKKFIKKTHKFLKEHSLFLLVFVLFSNYFAIEHSICTQTIHAIHYIHLIDVICGLFTVVISSPDIYRQVKEKNDNEKI